MRGVRVPAASAAPRREGAAHEPSLVARRFGPETHWTSAAAHSSGPRARDFEGATRSPSGEPPLVPPKDAVVACSGTDVGPRAAPFELRAALVDACGTPVCPCVRLAGARGARFSARDGLRTSCAAPRGSSAALFGRPAALSADGGASRESCDDVSGLSPHLKARAHARCVQPVELLDEVRGNEHGTSEARACGHLVTGNGALLALAPRPHGADAERRQVRGGTGRRDLTVPVVTPQWGGRPSEWGVSRTTKGNRRRDSNDDRRCNTNPMRGCVLSPHRLEIAKEFPFRAGPSDPVPFRPWMQSRGNLTANRSEASPPPPHSHAAQGKVVGRAAAGTTRHDPSARVFRRKLAEVVTQRWGVGDDADERGERRMVAVDVGAVEQGVNNQDGDARREGIHPQQGDLSPAQVLNGREGAVARRRRRVGIREQRPGPPGGGLPPDVGPCRLGFSRAGHRRGPSRRASPSSPSRPPRH